MRGAKLQPQTAHATHVGATLVLVARVNKSLHIGQQHRKRRTTNNVNSTADEELDWVSMWLSFVSWPKTNTVGRAGHERKALSRCDVNSKLRELPSLEATVHFVALRSQQKKKKRNGYTFRRRLMGEWRHGEPISGENQKRRGVGKYNSDESMRGSAMTQN